jgi:hypothetical protein
VTSTAPKAMEEQKSIERKTENTKIRIPSLILLLFLYVYAKAVPIGAPLYP